MGSEASLKLLQARETANHELDEKLVLSETHFGQMVERDGGCFHGFVLMGVGNVGSNGKRQLYYPTFSARFHGLSRQGVQLMSHFGGMMSITTYDRHQALFLTAIRTMNQYGLVLLHTVVVVRLFVRTPWYFGMSHFCYFVL
jgi:hypothetical protein